MTEAEQKEVWYCYLLRSTISGRTYNGSTNDLKRRLRQHNGELSGGAVATKTGQPWVFFAVLKGLPDHVNALSCEWRIRHPDGRRKKKGQYSGTVGRIQGLNKVLQLDQWSSRCMHRNQEMNLELHILPDAATFLDVDKIMDNIKVTIVDEIVNW